MNWLGVITLLILLRTSESVNESPFQRVIINSFCKSVDRDKSESLTKLLRSIAIEYLGNCALYIIYDSNNEKAYDAEDFCLHSGNTSFYLSFAQKKVNFSSSEPELLEQPLQTCTNYIIFLKDMFSIKHVMTQNKSSKIIVVSAESPWEVKDFLKSHVSRSYTHLLAIAHSTSHRTRNGTYLLYTHKLYAEGSGSTEPLLLTSWINNSLSDKNISLFPDKLKDGFMGHRLLTSVIENPPFTIKKSMKGSTDDFKWDGLEIRLLKLAAAYLNFTIEFMEPRSTASSPIESLKNDILFGISSVAIGGIYQTLDSTELFDATVPHAEDCAAFISLASTALPKYRAILGPFQLSVWILLCFAYLLLIVPLSFNSNYTILSLIKHPAGLNHMFWFVFSTYTNSFVVKNPLLNYGMAKNSISILLGIYWVFTIIVTACYTGSILSFIILPAYPSAMETATDLLAYRYRIGTLDHNGWEKWFSVNTSDPFLKSLFRKIEYVPSLLEGVQNASRAYFWPYAFLASKTSLDYLIQTDFAPTWTTKRSLMHVSKECFVRYNVIQLYPFKSLYTKPMNDFLYRATETGLIDKIVIDIDWEVQRTATKMNKQITKRMSQKVILEERTLTVEDTEGMFLLLGIGILLALVVLSFESLTNCLRNRKTGKNNKNCQDYTKSHNRLDFSPIHKDIYFPHTRQRQIRRSL